jgi:hypothetical protein
MHPESWESLLALQEGYFFSSRSFGSPAVVSRGASGSCGWSVACAVNYASVSFLFQKVSSFEETQGAPWVEQKEKLQQSGRSQVISQFRPARWQGQPSVPLGHPRKVQTPRMRGQHLAVARAFLDGGGPDAIGIGGCCCCVVVSRSRDFALTRGTGAAYRGTEGLGFRQKCRRWWRGFLASVSLENWSQFHRHLSTTRFTRHCFSLDAASPLFGQSYRHDLNFAS